MNSKFHLSSEDCEFLLAFEKAKSLQKLSSTIKRDVSVVSRRLQKIASKSPVLEKVDHRWRLTEVGYEINRWTEEAISHQAKKLSQKTEVRLGASRMFASKVLAQHLPEFQRALGNFSLSIVSLDGPLEPYLLNGSIDVAFTCGRPQNPGISYRRLTPERYVAVASKEFLNQYLKNGKSIYDTPFLAFRTPSGLYPFHEIVSQAKLITATFNDPLSLLDAVCSHSGWSILPYYAIKNMTDVLAIIPNIVLESETYGIWWLRERASPKPIVDFATKWLREQKL